LGLAGRWVVLALGLYSGLRQCGARFAAVYSDTAKAVSLTRRIARCAIAHISKSRYGSPAVPAQKRNAGPSTGPFAASLRMARSGKGY